MAFRRSIIGSLRSPSSSFGFTAIAPERSFLSEVNQTFQGTAIQKNILVRILEKRPPPPELDRSVDLLVLSDLELLSEDKLPDVVKDSHPFFTLPMNVRRRIYGFCFPKETRKLSLSPRFATKAVFSVGYFASPWDVLDPVSGGLEAFSALRRDLYAYFWTEYHFHITITPFSGPMFSPLSHVWLINYLDIIQNLTVEADLTRFGCCVLKEAPKYGYGRCQSLKC